MLIRLLPDGRAEWLEPDTRTIRRDSLESLLGSLASAERFDLLVPGEDVLVTSVEVAARQRHKLLQAVPYAVEDQLVAEVDRYHFAVGPKLGPQRYLVAAVASEQLDAWLQPFLDADLRPASVVPDTLAVPVEPDTAVLVQDGPRCLLRISADETYAGDIGEIETYLELANVPRVLAYGSVQDSSLSHPGMERRDTDTAALPLLDRFRGQAPLVDLLQGAYAVDDPRLRQLSGIWRWAAVLALAAVLLETTAMTVDYFQRQAQLDALNQEAADLLRETFPDIQRVVQPRMQMAQRLEQLRGGAASDSGVLYLLQLAGPALSNDAELTLQSLSYRNGVMTLDVQGPDIAAIEALRQRLIDGDLLARLESATTQDGNTRARVRLEARS